MALTAAEQAELAALKADPALSKLTPEERAELAALRADPALKNPPMTATDVALSGVQAAAKGLDYTRGATGGPLVGDLISLVSGKEVYNDDDLKNALNPMSTKTFPTTSEMLGRAGVPEGAKLSDFLKIYKKPEEAAWYEPEEGGMLDPSVRGTIGTAVDIASDPLTYATMGANAIGKEALKKGASVAAVQAAKDAAPTLSRRLMNATKAGVQKIPGAQTVGEWSQNLARTPGINQLSQVASAPSRAMGGLGKIIYNSTLTNVEAEGKKFAKENVGETLRRLGVKTPFALSDETSGLTKILLDKRDAILKEASDAGARMDPDQALKYAYAEIEQMANSRTAVLQDIAGDMRPGVDAEHAAMSARKEIMEGPHQEIRGFEGPGHEVVGYEKGNLSGNDWQELEPLRGQARTGTYRELPPQPPFRGGGNNAANTTSKDLARAGDDVGRKMEPPTSGVGGGRPLPVGNSQPLDTNLSEHFQNWMKETGFEPHGTPGPIEMGQLKESFTPGASEQVFDSLNTVAPKAIPGKYRPARAIPGEMKPGVMQKGREAANLTEGQVTKQTFGAALPPGKYADDAALNARQKVTDAVRRGAREDIENQVGKTLGEDAQRSVIELNDDAGKILSTRRSIRGVENQAARDLNKMNPTKGLSKILLSMDPVTAAKYIALTGVGTMTMPLGYGMTKIAESGAAPLIDAYARTKLKQAVSNSNPWEIKDGKEK